MPAKVIASVLRRLKASNLQRAAVLLDRWHAVVQLLGSRTSAERVLQGAGALLLQYDSGTLAANFAGLQAAGTFTASAATELVTRAPMVLSVPAHDVAARVRRYAALFGSSEEDAAAWLAKHPSAWTTPVQDPEQCLQRLQQLLPLSSVQQRQLREKVRNGDGVAIQAAFAQAHRAQTQLLVRKSPTWLAGSFSTLADKVQHLCTVLDASPADVADVVLRTNIISMRKDAVSLRLQLLATRLGWPMPRAQKVALALPSLLGMSPAGLGVLAQRLQRLEALVSECAQWQQQWHRYPDGTKLSLASLRSERADRLVYLLHANKQGRVAVSSALRATAAKWAAAHPEHSHWTHLQPAASLSP